MERSRVRRRRLTSVLQCFARNRCARPPSSVRNRLAARVVAVQPGSPLLCVELDAGFPLFAFITRPACEELGLHPCGTVTARSKAPAVHLIARET